MTPAEVDALEPAQFHAFTRHMDMEARARKRAAKK